MWIGSQNRYAFPPLAMTGTSADPMEPVAPCSAAFNISTKFTAGRRYFPNSLTPVACATSPRAKPIKTLLPLSETILSFSGCGMSVPGLN